MKRTKMVETSTQDELHYSDEEIKDILLAHAKKVDKAFKNGKCEFVECNTGGIFGAYVRVTVTKSLPVQVTDDGDEG